MCVCDQTFLVAQAAIITFLFPRFIELRAAEVADRLYQFAASWRNLLVKYSERSLVTPGSYEIMLS